MEKKHESDKLILHEGYVLKNTAWALFALHLLAFVILYVPNYVIEHDSTALVYIVEFAVRLFKFTLPIILATVLFCTSSFSAKRLILRSGLLSLTSLIYNLPYYYLVYLAQGNDSLESLLLSLAASVVAALLFAVTAALICLVMKIAVMRTGRKIYIDKLPFAYREKPTKEMIKTAERDVIANLNVHLCEGRLIDLTSPVTFALFGGCFVQFTFSVISELFTIIAYLVEYVGDYRNDEIIYIVVALVFIFAELFAAQAVAYFVKKLTVKQIEEVSDGEDDEAVGE